MYNKPSFEVPSFNPMPASQSNPSQGSKGLVGGVLGFASTLLTNRANRKEAARQREWNEQMMDKQNEFSLDMWNKTNEYNDPSNAVQRLRDAGLNPLFYGLDGSSTGAASGLESASAGPSSMPGIENPGSAAADVYQKVQGLAQQFRLQNAEINNLNAETVSKEIQNEIDSITKDAQVKQRLIAAKQAEQDLSNSIEQEKLIIAQAKETLSRSDLNKASKDLAEQQIKESEAKVSFMEFDKQMRVKEFELNSQMTRAQIRHLSKLDYEIEENVAIAWRDSNRKDFNLYNIDWPAAMQAYEIGDIARASNLLGLELNKETFESQVKQAMTDAKLSESQARWYVFSQVMNTVTSLAQTASMAYGASKIGSKALSGTSGTPYPRDNRKGPFNGSYFPKSTSNPSQSSWQYQW